MAVTEVVRDLTNLFNYSTDENPTSQQDYQEAVKNWVNTIINLVDCTMWQPNTEYEVGNVLRTPSLPLQLQLTCTTAGTTGSAEPDYSEVEAGDTVTDGTAVFLVDTVVSDGTMVAEAIKALASANDVPSGVTFGSTTLLSKMIANMNTQDGVQYNLSNANSWYICLGAKYGGLIIQGGVSPDIQNASTAERVITFPVSFSSGSSYRIALGRRWITNANEDYYFNSNRTGAHVGLIPCGTIGTAAHGYDYIAIGC